jgi:NADH:ubiquinone oxidoreductase subunit C
MTENRLDLLGSLEKAESLLSTWTDAFTRPDDHRVDAVLAAKDLHPAVAALVAESWGYLAAITGIDRPAAKAEDGSPLAEDEIEILYTFCWGAAVLSLHVRVAYSELVVDTVCDLIPSASFYERELMEMYGVVVENTPNPERLMLPDIWPEGVYPLRKSFSGLQDPNPRGS